MQSTFIMENLIDIDSSRGQQGRFSRSSSGAMSYTDDYNSEYMNSNTSTSSNSTCNSNSQIYKNSINIKIPSLKMRVNTSPNSLLNSNNNNSNNNNNSCHSNSNINSNANSKYINYLPNSTGSHGSSDSLGSIHSNGSNGSNNSINNINNINMNEYYSPKYQYDITSNTNNNTTTNNIIDLFNVQYSLFKNWLSSTMNSVDITSYIPQVLYDDLRQLYKYKLCMNLIYILVIIILSCYILVLVNLFTSVDLSKVIIGATTSGKTHVRRVVWV